MNKKEIEKRLLIFTGEIDIEDIKKDFINDEVNEDVFNRCLKLYYAIDDAIREIEHAPERNRVF